MTHSLTIAFLLAATYARADILLPPPQFEYLVSTNTSLISALRLINTHGILTVAGNSCDYAPAPVASSQQATDFAGFVSALNG